MRSLVVCLLFATATPAAVQQAGETERFRAVDSETGDPHPGVPLHLVPRDAMHDPTDGSGDWVTTAGAALRQLRASVESVRTDPEGYAKFARRFDPNEYRVFIGQPFRGRVLGMEDGVRRVPVIKLRPFSVKATDASGRPFAGFAIALRAGRDELAVALTDSRGIATLGVEPKVTARMAVVPAGWIGPLDGFPTLASMLSRKRPTMVVPEHGFFRIRFLERGEATRAKVTTATVYEPSMITAVVNGSRLVRGYEFGPVALGQRLRGYFSIAGESSRQLLADGPRTAGELVVLDVELDPPRPKIGFQVVGGARRAGRSLRVVAFTAEGTRTANVQLDEDGRARLDFGRRGLPRTRLIRIDIDGTDPRRDDVPACAWSATLSVDRPLENGVLDLGAVELEKLPAALRGRVLDSDGEPVPHASVRVDPETADGHVTPFRTTVTTDAKGRFELVGPPYRGDGGRLLRMRARVGDGENAAHAPVAVGSEIELVVRRDTAAGETIASSAPGEVRFALPVPHAVAQQLQITLQMDSQRPLRPPTDMTPVDGATVYRIRAVAAGKHSLRIAGAVGGDIAVIEGLDVPSGGTCKDPRLERLALDDRLRVASFFVVDRDGVPIAGATIETRLVGRNAGRATDVGGRATLVTGPIDGLQLSIGAPGKRQQVLPFATGEQTIVLEDAAKMAVRVAGLPQDFDRKHLRVSVFPDGRGGGFYRVAAPLGANDTTTLPLPARGRYWISLDVVVEQRNGMRGSRIVQSADTIAIGDTAPPLADATLAVDAAALQRVRERLQSLIGR